MNRIDRIGMHCGCMEKIPYSIQNDMDGVGKL
jgi:hypothetical protein